MRQKEKEERCDARKTQPIVDSWRVKERNYEPTDAGNL